MIMMMMMTMMSHRLLLVGEERWRDEPKEHLRGRPGSWVSTIKWSTNVLINRTFDTQLNTPALQYHDHLGIAIHPLIWWGLHLPAFHLIQTLHHLPGPTEICYPISEFIPHLSSWSMWSCSLFRLSSLVSSAITKGCHTSFLKTISLFGSLDFL